jgi:Flp pilus assembly protein TadG
MTKSIYTLFFIMLFAFVACNDSTNITNNTEDAEARSATGITVDVTLDDKSVVHLLASDFAAQYSAGNHISVQVNLKEGGTYTTTAAEVDAYQGDDALRITKNPGDGQVIYSAKNHLHIGTNTSGQLVLDISGGGISTTASSMIGDETEGI